MQKLHVVHGARIPSQSQANDHRSFAKSALHIINDAEYSLTSGSLPSRTNTELWRGELKLLTRETTGLSQRKVDALNRSLVEVWTRGVNECWIIARVRAELLHLTRGDYIKALGGRNPNVIKDIESRDEKSRPHLESYTRILKDWEKRASECEGSPRASELREARNALLDELLGESRKSGWGVLAQWRYEIGKSTFEQCTGLTYGSMWARQKSGSPIGFSELVTAAKLLNLVGKRSSPLQLAKHPCIKQAAEAWLCDSEKLQRPRPTALIHLYLERAGYSVNSNTLRTEFGVPASAAQAIVAYQQPRWKKIASLVEQLREMRLISKEEHSELEKCCREYRQAKRSLFSRKIEQRLQQMDLNSTQLVELFDLKAKMPHAKKLTTAVSHVVRRGRYNSQIPFGVLAAITATSEKDFYALLKIKRTEIVDDLRRKGHLNFGLRVECRLWGVRKEELGLNPAALEQVFLFPHRNQKQVEAVQAKIEQLGTQKYLAVKRRYSALTSYDSTRDAVEGMKKYHKKSYRQIAESVGISAPRFSKILQGKAIASLHSTRLIANAINQPWKNEFEIQWRLETAEAFLKRGYPPLARALQLLIMEHYETRSEFIAQNLGKFEDYRYHFQHLVRRGYLEESTFKKTLAALGIPLRSPQENFLQTLRGTENFSLAVKSYFADSGVAGPLYKLSTLKANLQPVVANPQETVQVLRDLPGITRTDLGEMEQTEKHWAQIENLTSLDPVEDRRLYLEIIKRLEEEHENSAEHANLFTRAFYGDSNGFAGTSARLEVFRVRRQFRFHSISYHPDDLK